MGAPIAFGINTFARYKNDYHLGPLFSTEGRVTVDRARLELLVALHLDFGVMDYAGIDDCFALVEIAHWSRDDVQRAIDARHVEVSRGEFFSARDKVLWGTPRDLVNQLRASASAQMRSAPKVGGLVIRDEWDGSRETYTYTYRVPQLAANA